MPGDRYVVVGLAHVRSGWFRELSRWSTGAALPVEFVKCVSPEELRARLASNRPFSAVLVDAGLSAVDRDLLDLARRSGCAVIVVDDGRAVRDWIGLGASAVLPAAFTRDDLVEVLHQHAPMIGRGDDLPVGGKGDDPAPNGWRGRLVAVTGSGGTGASTAAMALAQGLGDDVRHGGLVVLADLALHAEQAMLHDARDVLPGVPELVEAHRGGRPPATEIRSLTYDVAPRRYHLLLGLRRHRDWSAVRPRALEAALDGLRRTFRMVVCDVDHDVEGEDQCGSADVEDRNLMARTAMAAADVVLVVGTPGVKGLHSLVRVVADLAAYGVDPPRLVPVVNRTSRHARARATISSTIGALLTGALGGSVAVGGPVFLPDRGGSVDDAVRDGVRLPAALSRPLVGAVDAVLDRVQPPTPATRPVRVTPGSLGTWSEETG